MAADRKLLVRVVGDDRSFQATLAASSKSTAKFAQTVNKNLGGVSVQGRFAPLLGQVKDMQDQTQVLQDRLAQTDASFDKSARAAGGLGSALGLLGKASLISFGLTATYQASQQLSESLQQTGKEAFTTAGKLRNMSAALLQGDLVGGIQALRASPKTLEELGISATEAGNRLGALEKVADGTAKRLLEQAQGADGSKEKFKQYNAIVDEAGTSNARLAGQLVALVGGLRAAENAQAALADETARLGTVFRDASGQAVIFKGAVDDISGPRGPGLVDQINAALEVANRGKQGAGAQKPLGPSSKNANALVIAQATGDLDEVLRLQKVERERLAQVLANSHGNVKQRQALAQDYAAAKAAVITTTKQIAAAAQAQAAAARAQAKADAEAARQAKANSFAKLIGSLSLGVSKAELTKPLKNDLTALLALKAGLEKQIKAGVDVAAARSKLVTVTGEIATKNEAIRLAAKDALQAQQFKSLGLSASGDEIVPGIENLAVRIKGALAKVSSGQIELSSKLVGHLKAAQRQIRKEGDNLTEETRKTINEWIKAASGQDAKTLAKPPVHINLSEKILKALGFDKNLDVSRLSRLNITGAGARPLQPVSATNAGGMTFTGPITVVADNPDAFLRELQKKAGRTTATARGRFPGRSLGLG